MDNKISIQAKAELVRAPGQRYRESSKMAKTQILDEFIAVSGNLPWLLWYLPKVLRKGLDARVSINSWLNYPVYGRLERCDRHIEPNLQSHGIGGPEKTPLKQSGTMCFIGYSRSPMLQQRLYLNVSKMNTPGISLMVNSEHCSAEFENGEQLWRENLCMLVLMETKNIIRRYRLY